MKQQFKALAGSRTIVRFLIEGEYGADISATVLAGLKQHAITTSMDNDIEQNIGWAPFEAPYTDDFQENEIRYGDNEE